MPKKVSRQRALASSIERSELLTRIYLNNVLLNEMSAKNWVQVHIFSCNFKKTAVKSMYMYPT